MQTEKTANEQFAVFSVSRQKFSLKHFFKEKYIAPPYVQTYPIDFCFYSAFLTWDFLDTFAETSPSVKKLYIVWNFIHARKSSKVSVIIITYINYPYVHLYEIPYKKLRWIDRFCCSYFHFLLIFCVVINFSPAWCVFCIIFQSMLKMLFCHFPGMLLA